MKDKSNEGVGEEVRLQYLLASLVEELGEAGQILGKSQKFGLGSINPDDLSGGTNLHKLQLEMADVIGTWKVLCDKLGVVCLDRRLLDKKSVKLSYWFNWKHGEDL